MPNWELENVKGITDAQVQNNMPLTREKRKERVCLHTQSTQGHATSGHGIKYPLHKRYRRLSKLLSIT